MVFLSASKGDFFLRKKPLECVLSDYSNSESAIEPVEWMMPDPRGSNTVFQPVALGKLFSNSGAGIGEFTASDSLRVMTWK